MVLEKDVSETDLYGRLLHYVYMDSEVFNDKQVKEGYAMITTFTPDVKYSEVFPQSEREVRGNELGFWSMCKE